MLTTLVKTDISGADKDKYNEDADFKGKTLLQYVYSLTDPIFD